MSASASLLQSALTCRANGHSIVPIDHRTKRPAGGLLPDEVDDAGNVVLHPKTGRPKKTWKPFQETPATEEEIRRWFRAKIKAFAIVGGAVSGGRETLDFDEPGKYEAWCIDVGELADGLPVQRTGSGTYQVAWRCPKPSKNQKLAYVPDEDEEDGRRIAIETRGEAGYAVVPGSLHPSGNYYETISGDWFKPPLISQARRNALLLAAQNLCEAPKSRQELEAAKKATTKRESRTSTPGNHGSVIDLFNERYPIEQELERHDYTEVGDRYLRPNAGGESVPGVIITDGKSFHFSSNDPLNNGHQRDAFDVFCYYEHNGDVGAAVKAAARMMGLPPIKREEEPEQPKVDKSFIEPGRDGATSLLHRYQELEANLWNIVTADPEKTGWDTSAKVLGVYSQLALFRQEADSLTFPGGAAKVAPHVGLSKTTISTHADRLEKAGLAYYNKGKRILCDRKRRPVDPRSVNSRLSPAEQGLHWEKCDTVLVFYPLPEGKLPPLERSERLEKQRQREAEEHEQNAQTRRENLELRATVEKLEKSRCPHCEQEGTLTAYCTNPECVQFVTAAQMAELTAPAPDEEVPDKTFVFKEPETNKRPDAGETLPPEKPAWPPYIVSTDDALLLYEQEQRAGHGVYALITAGRLDEARDRLPEFSDGKRLELSRAIEEKQRLLDRQGGVKHGRLPAATHRAATDGIARAGSD